MNATKLSQEYFDIQLEEASSKTPYEPYTGLKPSPSPEYPQEIKSCGRKSKNIFNKNAVKQGYEFGAMLSDAETVKQGWFVSDFMPVKATTYQISGKKTGAGCKLYSKDKVFVKNIQAPFGGIKIEEGIAYFRINGEIKDLDNIQVEEGTVATDYEPYSDTCLLDVKVTGKNLIKTSPILLKRWSNNIDNHVIEYVTLKPHTTYTLAMEEDTNYVNDLRVRIFSKNDMTRWLVELLGSGKNKEKFTTKDDAECVLCVYHLLDYKGDVKQLQLVEGDISTPYEPYTEQTVQIALDEPLRGIGEYKDMLTKDGVVRKIYPPYEINLNDLRDGGYSRTNTVMFSVKVQNKTVGYASLKPSILCNIFPDCGLQTGNIYNDDKECIAVGGTIVLFRVNKSRLKDISSFEATKQSFIELMEGKKMLVEYALETPVTEPLPESAQQQLQALHSENGVTHVFVDSGEVPCGIKLTYRKEI